MNKVKTLGLPVLLTLFGSFVVFVDKTLAEDCVQVVVPFTWTLSQTTGPGASSVGLSQENDGPTGNTTTRPEGITGGTLDGFFTIGQIHNAPSSFCARLDALPEEVGVNVIGTLNGTYGNSTLNTTLAGIVIDTYTKTSGSINILDPFVEQVQGTGAGPFGVQSSKQFKWGIGQHPYLGTINASTKFGFGSGTVGDKITLVSQLNINGSFARGQGTANIRYTVPVPEPLTMLGSAAAVGFVAAFNRRLAKVTKDDKNS